MDVRCALRVSTGDKVNGHLLDVRIAEAGTRGVAGVFRIKAGRRHEPDGQDAEPGGRCGKIDDLDLSLLLFGNDDGLVHQRHTSAQIVRQRTDGLHAAFQIGCRHVITP